MYIYYIMIKNSVLGEVVRLMLGIYRPLTHGSSINPLFHYNILKS